MAKKNSDEKFIDMVWQVMWNNISPAMGMDEGHMRRLRELALDGVKYRAMGEVFSAQDPDTRVWFDARWVLKKEKRTS